MLPGTDILFTKFSATGNDFILIDNRRLGFSADDAEFFRWICQRRIAVGADGVLLIDESRESDFCLHYYNSDGSEAECGNGACSAAFFAFTHGIAPQKMTFHFGGHLYEAEVKGRAVKLKLPAARNLDQSVGILEETGLEEGGSVNTGVPHYVLFGREIDKTNVIAVGRKYRYHPHFQPHGTNVNFVEVAGDEEIRVRTYERGVEDETLSCGSGSVASAFLAHLQKEVSFPVRVRTRGGVLVVHKNQEAAQFYLEGKVEPVYQGKLKAFR